jgi:hypothetical protein
MVQHNKLAFVQRIKLVLGKHGYPFWKTGGSLEILRGLQNANGAVAIRARDMTRTHRERLLKHGFLQEVIKGWYIPSRPDEVKGESTAWYASFWRNAFRQELEPVAGAIAVPSRWELDGSPATRSAVSQRPEQCHEASAWDILVRT